MSINSLLVAFSLCMYPHVRFKDEFTAKGDIEKLQNLWVRFEPLSYKIEDIYVGNFALV
jgi:hypothetical protein